MTDASRADPRHERDDLTQHKAAEVLGVSVWRVGWWVACGHLDQGAEQYTATSASVRAEVDWRRSASLSERLVRLVRDTVRWF